jgi:hypothetical protein
MKYEPIKKHYKHPMYIQIGNYGPHKGKMMCKLCNEFIKWATIEEINTFKEIKSWQNKSIMTQK